MKSYLVLGFGMCAALAFTSCKSNESAYKKAYEKALLQDNAANQNTQSGTKVEVAPVITDNTVETNAPVKDYSNETFRQEKVELISGEGLKDYSVVCGSFSLKPNAEGLQATLKSKGYKAQIAYKAPNYRVIASTFADKASAVESRNELRASYPDAWLLYNK